MTFSTQISQRYFTFSRVPIKYLNAILLHKDPLDALGADGVKPFDHRGMGLIALKLHINYVNQEVARQNLQPYGRFIPSFINNGPLKGGDANTRDKQSVFGGSQRGASSPACNQGAPMVSTLGSITQ